MKSQRNYFVRNASVLCLAPLSFIIKHNAHWSTISTLLARLNCLPVSGSERERERGSLEWLDGWTAGCLDSLDWPELSLGWPAWLRSCNCLCHFFDGLLLTCRRFSHCFSHHFHCRRREATLARSVN